MEPFLSSLNMWFLKSLPCIVSPFFSGWHIWVFYGSKPTAFVSLFNSVLDMLNYWDACRMEVIGWSLKNTWIRSFVISNNCGFSSHRLAACIPNTKGEFKSDHQPVNIENKCEITTIISAIWCFQNHCDFRILQHTLRLSLH